VVFNNKAHRYGEALQHKPNSVLKEPTIRSKEDEDGDLTLADEALNPLFGYVKKTSKSQDIRTG
jgi:hypothetical protein